MGGQQALGGLAAVVEVRERAGALRASLLSTSALLGAFIHSVERAADSAAAAEDDCGDLGVLLTGAAVGAVRPLQGGLEGLAARLGACAALPVAEGRAGGMRGLLAACCLSGEEGAGRERTHYFALARALLPPLRAAAALGPGCGGAIQLEGLTRACSPEARPACSLSSSASFSYSPGPGEEPSGSESGDSGVLSCREQRYSTVRRSPSPALGARTAAMQAGRPVDPPTVPLRRPAQAQATQPSPQSTQPSPQSTKPSAQATQSPQPSPGPWGAALSLSSLFPTPRSSYTDDGRDHFAAISNCSLQNVYNEPPADQLEESPPCQSYQRDRRRQRRARNLTQAVSLSSLSTSPAPLSTFLPEPLVPPDSPSALPPPPAFLLEPHPTLALDPQESLESPLDPFSREWGPCPPLVRQRAGSGYGIFEP